MKLALCLTDGREGADGTEFVVREMLEAQRDQVGCQLRLLPFAFGSLGMVGRPDEAPADWLAWEGEDGSFLVFAGLPLSHGDGSPGRLGAAHPLVRAALGGAEPARTRSRLGALDGAFVAVWWSAARGELTVITDILGMQPLYRAEGNDYVRFASEVKALARAADGAPDPDAGAWGAMFAFGHQVGERTLLRGATRVSPAQLLTFAAPKRATSEWTWQWPSSGGGADSGVRTDASREELLDAIGAAVRADVAAYAAACPGASLLLSGGFDSRLILCLCRDVGVCPRVLVQSHPDENGDADARFALAFARTLGISPRVVPAAADFFGSESYLRFLERNEVATPSLYLFIPHVAAAVEGERHGVWEGLLLDPALKFDYGEGGFDPYLEARTGRRRREVQAAVRLAFSPVWHEQMEAEYDALLAGERSRYTDDAEGVWRFSVLNRSRFRTGTNPYQVYDTTTPVLTPGMSRGFWNVAAAIDPRRRFGKRLYRAVFEHLAPDGLRVPVASGASLLAGSSAGALYHVQRARAVAQRVAKRPRVARFLRSAGLPAPFAWRASPFPDVALSEALLDDPRVNADWVRSQRLARAAGARGGEGATPSLALELLMYWQAWHHVMRGELLTRWGRGRAA